MPGKRIFTYVERLYARKREREGEQVTESSSMEAKEAEKVDLREKEEQLMAKARYFVGTKANARYVGFLYICTRLRASYWPYRHRLNPEG